MPSAFETAYEKLPDSLPVFPLPGIILLPGGVIPLNIFEPRYINLVLDSLAGSRLVGIVQPQEKKFMMQQPDLYSTGCAGRITHFEETDDGRLLITLRGVSRFEITGEMPTTRGYRRTVVAWERFRDDLNQPRLHHFNRDELYQKLGVYFRRHNVDVDWNHVKEIPSPDLINYLSQNLPFEARDKQALLEANSHQDRIDTLFALIEMEIAVGGALKKSRH